MRVERMDSNNNETGPVIIAKLISVWAAVGVTSWSDFAAFLASCYTAILIGEWCWKRFGKSLARKWGLVK